MSAIANAALPVAVGLIMLAAVARAVLEWSTDQGFVRLSSEYLEPLTTWCLIATFVYVGAHAASGDIGVLTIVIAAIIGGSAVFVRDSATEAPLDEEPVSVEPTAPAPAPAVAPNRTAGALWARREY